MTKGQLKTIFDKTSGHCHFCGDPLEFTKRGYNNGDIKGSWVADHVIQKGKGGDTSHDNCLAACYKCNRLRWFYKSDEIQNIMFLRIIARHEIKKNSVLGKTLIQAKEKRLAQNEARRVKARAKANA